MAQSAISRIERGLESPSFERFEYLVSCLGLQAGVELEPMRFRGDVDLLDSQAHLSPSTRLEGGFNNAAFGRQLRKAVLAASER